MKKTIIRVATLLLAFCMLAGCGSTAVSSTPTDSEPLSDVVSVAEESQAEQANEPEPVEEASYAEETSVEDTSAAEEVPEAEGFVPVEYELPLVDNPETLTYFTTMSPNNSAYMEDYSTNTAVQALEEMTGVHIEYECYIPENAQTQFNLQAAAGSLPDMILAATEYYTGGMDSAVEEEVLLNLADYIDDCPNFKQILSITPEMEKTLTTDAGNLIGFYPYSDPSIATPISGGILIRGDWLDKVGMDVPKTYDEVHDVLTAFKNELGIETPMLLNSYLDDQSGAFASGYDIKAFFMTSPGIQVPFYVVDGQVKCAIVEDDFISYIDMLQNYIAEGLIDPGVESYSNERSYQDKVIAGDIGFFWGFAVRDMETLNSQIEDGYVSAVPMIRKTEDQTLHFTSTTSYQVRYAVSLSANCSNIELACKWLDAHYGTEISMLSMYGVEGEGYEMDGDTPHYTEMMKNSGEDGLTLTVQKALHCLGEADNIYYSYINTELENYSEAQVEALTLLNSGAVDDAYIYPSGASMTTDEEEEFTALIADLSTYMAEHVLKFVTGAEDMSEYQAFVDALNEIGMQDAIAIKQAAYDRYIGA